MTGFKTNEIALTTGKPPSRSRPKKREFPAAQKEIKLSWGVDKTD
jgi:hypothetical protein